MSESKWVYVDNGTEYGWFSDAERAEMDATRTPQATYTWRELTASEISSFKSYVGRLSYEQS